MTTADTEPPHALIERRGHVLVVTMNRPQVRNALSGPMLALLRQAWDQVDSDPGIRACVLTGAGGAFCAGADLKAMTRSQVAGESARFGVPEARWGLFPLGGSAVRLPRQIPYTVAADLLLTGRHITAAQAREIGLIGHVVPDGQALATALEIAETIAANGPVAVRAILQTMRETEGLAEADAFKIEARIGMEVFRSHDAKEGPRAFTEKRKPDFHDR